MDHTYPGSQDKMATPALPLMIPALHPLEPLDSPPPLEMGEFPEEENELNHVPDDLVIEGEPPYQCKICGKVFAIPARLQRHHRVHTGEKPFKCEFCDKMFSVKENLNVHRRIHTKERPYQCTICNRAFEHSGKLHRHMRTHTGERPHKCELCGKTFVQSGQLVIHMRAHTGEKPYTCDYCQKGFTCSKQLKVHIRTHTGEKPYECDICGKTFGYNHVLKMHKMSHLGKKMYKCTLCDECFNSRKALDKHLKEHSRDPSSDDHTPVQDSDAYQNSEEILCSPQSSSRSSSSSPPAVIRIPPQPFRDLESSTLSPTYGENDGGSPKHSRRYYNPNSMSPQYVSDGRPRGYSPLGVPLTPPRSPDTLGPGPSVSSASDPLRSPGGSELSDSYTKDCLGNLFSYLKKPSYEYSEKETDQRHFPQLPKFVFITTITGERLACPAELLVRLQGPTSGSVFDSDPLKIQETLRMQKELQERLKSEEARKKREKSFCDSVLKVLESCIGKDKLHQLGYPKATIDGVIMNTLKLMGTEPCWEPSLAPMDRIKVNLRLLLECCVPDKELWDKFGWKGKSIEEIVSEFLEHC